jgi:hypothetical protein
MDRNGKSKGFWWKCVIKMAHILDFLHCLILVEGHNVEVIHCRVHWASVETGNASRRNFYNILWASVEMGNASRHNFYNILASVSLSLVSRQMGKEQTDNLRFIKKQNAGYSSGCRFNFKICCTITVGPPAYPRSRLDLLWFTAVSLVGWKLFFKRSKAYKLILMHIKLRFTKKLRSI